MWPRSFCTLHILVAEMASPLLVWTAAELLYLVQQIREHRRLWPDDDRIKYPRLPLQGKVCLIRILLL